MNRRWIAVMLGVPILVTPMVKIPVAQAEPLPLTQLFPALEGIQLTPEQRDQLETLAYQTLPQIQSVLTPDQQTQFASTLAAGKGMRVALSSLNLSVTQQLELRNLLQSTRAQVSQTLTPEQQLQLQTNAQSLQQQDR
nr:MAG: hypothetical protein EDM05_28315 [Leptolyngbya sp. IPPAS B-1204]